MSVLALPLLYDAVTERFAAEGTEVPMAFGWREPAARDVSMPRIVWVPGDDQSGAAGTVVGARYAGREPEAPLLNIDETFTVYVEAADESDPENERKQYEATRLLFDAWARAVHLAASGTVSIGSPSWVIEKTTRRHGATLRVVSSIQAVVPDAPLVFAAPDTGALQTTVVLDRTDVPEFLDPERVVRTSVEADLSFDADGVVTTA